MYIHHHTCISPQHTSDTVNLEALQPSKDGKLVAMEPSLEGVPPGMLRRMSKAVRMGLGAGLPLLKQQQTDGIIIGTANGGMEDCIKFLNQIIDYDEGMLTPGSFVQSTPNAIAGQLSLITANRLYNATHVHLGLSFENALLDAMMLLHDHPGNRYLVGGVDEISTYNYNIDFLAGWYGKELGNENLYDAGTPATIAGEGAAMFLVSDIADGALTKISALETLHSTDAEEVQGRFRAFYDNQQIDPGHTLLLTGENGDTRALPFFSAVETITEGLPVARFKHATGEYPTAASAALWLACFMLESQQLPGHFFKTAPPSSPVEKILLYNQYHGKQHSFTCVSKSG